MSCPPHHCATFNQYLLDNDGTLPVTSNVEYQLLPGEHHINATKSVVFTNFQNVSLVGKFNEQLQLPPVILIGTNFSVFDSYNITITNVVFKKIMLFHYGNLRLIECISCTIENVTLIGFGLLGGNLIGKSYLNNIVINLTKTSYKVNYCYDRQGITLSYSHSSMKGKDLKIVHKQKSVIKMQKISVYRDTNKCYTNKGIIKIELQPYQTEDIIEIVISDSKFNYMTQTIIFIKDNSRATMCMISVVNCTFESNINVINPPLSIITAEVPSFNATLNFVNCKFHKNTLFHGYLVLLVIHLNLQVIREDVNITACTNITFVKCNFIINTGGFVSLRNFDFPCKPSISFIGPMNIYRIDVTKEENMMYIENMHIIMYGPIKISRSTTYYNDMIVFGLSNIFMNGPITISLNNAIGMNILSLESCSNVLFKGLIKILGNDQAKSIMVFEDSSITFDKKILFVSNICDKIITIKSGYDANSYEYPYIKVMQNANVTFLDNQYYEDLLMFESNNDNNHPYPFCIFQYVSAEANTLTITPADYTIIFNENFLIDSTDTTIHTECTLCFKRFTSHCKWLPSSVFYDQNPGLINRQIIQINHEKVRHHTFICLTDLKLYGNCTTDILGPMYPGQTLQIEIFAPCSDDTNSIIFAETHNNLLPPTACKIAHQTELLNLISNYSGMINYTILSNSTDMCELFLTISPHLYYVYETFYVKLLPCPVGFTLQNGLCDCDPLLPPKIDACYIEKSVIRRPATMWITAHVQSNDTMYLTGNCPYGLLFTILIKRSVDKL